MSKTKTTVLIRITDTGDVEAFLNSKYTKIHKAFELIQKMKLKKASLTDIEIELTYE